MQQGVKNSVQVALKNIQGQISAALMSSKKTTSVELVGVSKTKPVELLQEAYDAGLRHFGENYVEEIAEKHSKLPLDIKWHFIGHLQSQKVKQVLVPNLYVLETIDSLKLAQKVEKQCEKLQRELNVYVQIKTSDEESKYGVDPKDSFELIQYIIEKCKFIKFKGLMTIGKSGDLQAFDDLYNLRVEVCNKFELNPEQIDLSMGMSADFAEAIAAGSTNVRVGSSIFGSRDYSKKEESEPQK